MAKILLTILILLILAFIVVALYCVLVVAGRHADNDSKGNNRRGNYHELFLEKQICPKCKTGKYTYELDRHSEMCPYVHCWRRNQCMYYKPLDKKSKTKIFGELKHK